MVVSQANQEKLQTSPGSGKPAIFVGIFIHGYAVGIFPIKLENDVRGVDGPVGGFVLAKGKTNRGHQRVLIIEDIIGIGIERDLRLRNRVSEVVGLGKPIAEQPLPHVAIPTTAGTGAEVTRNAVLGVPEHKVKVSMRSPLMLPSMAIVDPELTYSMPPAVTAATGLDALTQLAEAYTSNNANPLTDGVCCEGLQRAGRSLLAAYEDGSNADARQDMAIAGLFGGLALANAKLGAVHGFAGPLGGMIQAPHGVICAALLPHVMQANIRALQQREPDSPALARYDRIAALLTAKPEASADEGLEWLQNLCAALKTPALREFGLEERHYAEGVQKAQKASSMKGNPITLTDDELIEILSEARKGKKRKP